MSLIQMRSARGRLMKVISTKTISIVYVINGDI